MVFNSAMSEGSGEDSNLKVHKRDKFFASNFELLTFMHNYYFLGKFFSLDQYDGSYDRPRILSICGKSFSCKVCEKNYFKKLKYAPLKFLKIVFRNVVLLKAPEVVCLPISSRKLNV
jgi:hypothetical protein